MEEFLKVVYYNYADNETDGEIAIGDIGYEIFRPFTEELKKIVSPELFCSLEEVFGDCISENNIYYAVKGMALAIRIMNKEYTPFI